MFQNFKNTLSGIDNIFKNKLFSFADSYRSSYLIVEDEKNITELIRKDWFLCNIDTDVSIETHMQLVQETEILFNQLSETEKNRFLTMKIPTSAKEVYVKAYLKIIKL